MGVWFSLRHDFKYSVLDQNGGENKNGFLCLEINRNNQPSFLIYLQTMYVWNVLPYYRAHTTL